MRILIVEDEVKIAEAIKKGLALEKIAADVVHDGARGLSYALGDDYDLIILDVMLPKMDGIEVCKKIRAEGKQVPILLLTAKGELEDKVGGLNSGADDYLVKPFAFEELLARVRALARRPQALMGTILTVGDLVLDTVTYDVRRGNNHISLSSKEYALLEYMMRNAARIVTKDQIMQHVWDEDSDILMNTVEVYIGYLRNKIEKPFTGAPPLIHTVRGFGYRMSAEEKE